MDNTMKLIEQLQAIHVKLVPYEFRAGVREANRQLQSVIDELIEETDNRDHA